MKTLEEEIMAINDYTDQETVKKIIERIQFLNVLSPENKKVLEDARQKGLV